MIAVEIVHLKKSYRAHTVIDDLSLSVGAGERIAVTAPSGAGKTTLFRLIAGLEKPDGGSISTPLPIAYMFQEPRLFPQFTVWQNVASVMTGKSAKEKKREAEQWLTTVGLGEDLYKYPDELSGGMAQRAALARALAAGSEIFLLDEPFKGLDDQSKEELISVLDALLQNKTLLLVTHDEEEAKALSCRILRFGKSMKEIRENGADEAPADQPSEG